MLRQMCHSLKMTVLPRDVDKKVKQYLEIDRDVPESIVKVAN